MPALDYLFVYQCYGPKNSRHFDWKENDPDLIQKKNDGLDWTTFTQAKQLRTLHIDNGMDDITPFRAMHQLKHLMLDEINVHQISDLADFGFLESLQIRHINLPTTNINTLLPNTAVIVSENNNGWQEWHNLKTGDKWSYR